MSLRRTSHQLRQRNPLCLLLGLATGFWTLFYKFVGDRVILSFLPSSVHEQIQKKKKDDPRFDKMCRTNGTAFFHALIVSPAMAISLFRLREDPLWGESTFFDAMAIVVAGYFLWDFCICIDQYKEFGFSFLLHSLICISCMLFQLSASEMRTSCVIAGIISTECSTIFLHLRWFLIQGKQTSSLYFKLANFAFLAAFVGYRMYYMLMFNIIPYSKHILTFRSFGVNKVDTFRLWYQMFLSWLWIGLQYYWGLNLAKSQVSQIVKKWKKVV